MVIHVTYAHEEPYRALHPGEPTRPYIVARIQHGRRYVDTPALIDSGADGSIFHLQIAPVLGLVPDPSLAEITTGIGGDRNIWYFDVHLTVLGERFPARVGFTDGCPRAFGLLGRRDFFAAFHIGFEQSALRVLLNPYP